MTTTTPLGFKFAVWAAGFKKNDRPDLALLVSAVPAATAAMFTENVFQAAPVLVGRELVAKGGKFRAVLINSGQANACTGDEGVLDCRETQSLVARAAGLRAEEILPASTGVIGARLKMDIWKQSAPLLVENLGKNSAEDFARAIMTTDRFPKFASEEVLLPGGTIRLCGMAKGAGMICPDMATMLAVLLCDAAIDAPLWKKLLREAVGLTFNRVSVDGDTSTNDTIYALANGASGVAAGEKEAPALFTAMKNILAKLAYMLVQDGEGATKVIRIKVQGAKTAQDAERIARSIGHSPLVKTAMFGQDANWGRIVCALGYSKAAFNPATATLKICGIEVFRNRRPTLIDDDPALNAALRERDIGIDLSLDDGSATYELLASDLTHDYVTLNGDYRS
ncbi:MAG: bifunctional glutamate N-acetyltransferase/amino-acid acetyltransferase ArgJ [Deltaproteobacteria bacterium]|nr:bifunctional glutamate N-acetyltransferase/amino-acid acetyltransferase ArgJ [Deltaproteobacteria bacterium]